MKREQKLTMQFQISKLLSFISSDPKVPMGREKATCCAGSGSMPCPGPSGRCGCSKPVPCPSAAHIISAAHILFQEINCNASLFSLDIWLTCASQGYLNLFLNWKTGCMLHPLRNCFIENEVKDLDAELCHPCCELILLDTCFHTLEGGMEKCPII